MRARCEISSIKARTYWCRCKLGALTLPQAHREVTKILKTDRWTPALPFQAEAISDEEFGAYLAAVRPNRVHLLGIGPDSKRANNVVFQIKTNSPGTAVQMDSTVIRGRVGRARGIGPYTAAQDAARGRTQNGARLHCRG